MRRSLLRDSDALERVDREWLALVEPPQVAPRRVRDLGSVDRRWSTLVREGPRRSAVAERYFLDEILVQAEGFARYRARHAVLGQPVALTLLGGEPARSDARVEAGLRVEAADALRVPSNGLLPICDLGRMRSGQLYFAWPLPDAPSLAERLAAGPLGTAQAVAVVRQVGAALARLHEAGLVHHALRPEHIFVDERAGGTYARLWAVGHFSAVDAPHPTYAAPEQQRGQPPSVLSNVWSLAALACELLSGGRPQREPAQREPAVLLAPALRAALDPDPARRPASVAELTARLLGSAAARKPPR